MSAVVSPQTRPLWQTNRNYVRRRTMSRDHFNQLSKQGMQWT